MQGTMMCCGNRKGTEAQLTAKFEAQFPHLGERQRRPVAGAQARSLGYCGIRVVARPARRREGAVSGGSLELESGAGALPAPAHRPVARR
jgi:hypothetical protein